MFSKDHWVLSQCNTRLRLLYSLIYVFIYFFIIHHVSDCIACILCLGITSTVKASLEESLVQILSPRRRIDILRDAMDAKKRSKPYSITFCGVNGVGKSTNLAKVVTM